MGNKIVAIREKVLKVSFRLKLTGFSFEFPLSSFRPFLLVDLKGEEKKAWLESMENSRAFFCRFDESCVNKPISYSKLITSLNGFVVIQRIYKLKN